MKALAICVLLAGALMATQTGALAGLFQDARGCSNADRPPYLAGLDEATAATLCLLNKERRAHDLRPLDPNRVLARAAARHSRDMVSGRFYAHENRDGLSPHDRIRAAGYRGRLTAENIHFGFADRSTPVRIVDDWMDSPGHRKNILNPELQEIGIGIAKGAPRGGAGGATYTTNFGGPTGPNLKAHIGDAKKGS